MKLTAVVIADILQQSRKTEWDVEIPQVSGRLRLAINSLIASDASFFKKDSEEILKKINERDNGWVRKILQQSSALDCAFAIRDAQS